MLTFVKLSYFLSLCSLLFHKIMELHQSVFLAIIPSFIARKVIVTRRILSSLVKSKRYRSYILCVSFDATLLMFFIYRNWLLHCDEFQKKEYNNPCLVPGSRWIQKVKQLTWLNKNMWIPVKDFLSKIKTCQEDI